jgi:hypothetical protein
VQAIAQSVKASNYIYVPHASALLVSISHTTSPFLKTQFRASDVREPLLKMPTQPFPCWRANLFKSSDRPGTFRKPRSGQATLLLSTAIYILNRAINLCIHHYALDFPVSSLHHTTSPSLEKKNPLINAAMIEKCRRKDTIQPIHMWRVAFLRTRKSPKDVSKTHIWADHAASRRIPDSIPMFDPEAVYISCGRIRRISSTQNLKTNPLCSGIAVKKVYVAASSLARWFSQDP